MSDTASDPTPVTARISEVRWIALRSVEDPRGVLTSVEGGQDVPFEISRIFYMHHISQDRGGHAHRDTDQLIVAAAGSFELEAFDGRDSATHSMNDATRGLYVPRMILVSMSGFSPDAVCLVLASTHYDMARSLRSRQEFLACLAGQS